MNRHLALFLGLLTLVATNAAAAPLKGDRIDIGPPVGAHVPPFAARDMTGAPRSLASVMGPKGVVLVFFRSSRWCPYCQRQLMDLRSVAEPLARGGYKLAAISYDEPAQLATFAQKWDVKYTLLSDKGSAMIDAFRLRDPQYPADSFAYGVPKPSIFVIDRRGVVKAKIAREGYEIRPSNDEILAVAGLLR